MNIELGGGAILWFHVHIYIEVILKVHVKVNFKKSFDAVLTSRGFM